MKRKQLSFNFRSPGSFLPGLLSLLLLLTISACGSKNSVQIYDNARVLNSSKVQSVASNLANPVAIYTTNTFQGTRADFQRTALQKLDGNPNLIVMAIDTHSRYIYIVRGSQVPLSSTGINQAVNSFAGRFNNGDYTNASVAALNTLQNSIGSNNQSRGGISFSPLIPCLILPLLLILGVMFFAASKRNRMREGMATGGIPWERSRNPQFNEGPYYNPNQGYGPPNQGGGMNPWAAGGLGAAAGGLAGYELGKRAGERDSDRNYDDSNDFGGGGNFGNDGDFGNSGGGNFDNSGDVGGGGSFGGGSGDSNFSGGGSFGNGNDDFSSGGNDSGGGNF